MEFYAKTLRTACHAESAAGLLVISTAGCPNAAIAAARFELPVILLNFRVKLHTVFHQDEAASEYFMPPVADVPVPVISLSLKTHPQYMACKVVQPCALQLEDVAPDYEADQWAGSNWTARKLVSCVEEEAKGFGLTLSASRVATAKLGVFAVKHLDEGSKIATATSAFFTEKGLRLGAMQGLDMSLLRLEAGLSRPGHGKFRDRVVHVLLPKDQEVKELWAVLVGIAGEVMHCGGSLARKFM